MTVVGFPTRGNRAGGAGLGELTHQVKHVDNGAH